MSKISERLIAAVNRVNDGLLEQMCRDAEKLCKEAQATKETKNKTGSQFNAFFWIVCYKGKIKAVGGGKDVYQEFTHKGLAGTWWEDGYGYDWWWEFTFDENQHITSLAPQASFNKNGYDIYILNAAYYTGWLEKGMKDGKSKWRVISQIKSSCEQVAQKYKRQGAKRAEVHRIGLSGDKNTGQFKPAEFQTKK